MNETKQDKKIDFSAVVMLESLAQDLGIKHGHDTQGRLIASVEELTILAEKLSTEAGKEPPWSWRYLRNILNAKMPPSALLLSAIVSLGSRIDGVPAVLARATPAPMMYTIPEVKPGTVNLVKPKPCAYTACGVWFIGYPAQRYCCRECREAARKARSDESRQ